MRQTLTYILIALALVVPAGSAIASNENSPDCDANHDDNVPDAGPVRTCEGEHWNGSDNTGSAAGCDEQAVSDPSNLGVAYAHCGENQDSNGGAPGYENRPDVFANGATDAVHVRTTCDDGSACFVGLSIFGVGRANVMAASFGDTAVAAAYLRDDSDQTSAVVNGFVPLTCQQGWVFRCSEGNVLAEVVHQAGITRGQGVGEENDNGRGECHQSDYETRNCVRDNTAASVWINE